MIGWFILGFIGTFIMLLLSLAYLERFPEKISKNGTNSKISIAMLMLMVLCGPLTILLDIVIVYVIINSEIKRDYEID